MGSSLRLRKSPIAGGRIVGIRLPTGFVYWIN